MDQSKVEASLLLQRSREQLASRLQSDHDYNRDEINQVTNRTTALVPRGYVLSQEETDLLRSLTVYSQVELRPASEIRSHRKWLGPIIVVLKRATWPLLAIHLKETFASLREFCAGTVVIVAKQMVTIRQLEVELAARKDELEREREKGR